MHRAALASAFALSVLVLAGCLGDDGDDNGLLPTPPVVDDQTPRFSVPVAVGAKVGEPGLRLQDGVVWVHAPHGLWKSMDNGTTFQEVPVMGQVCSLPVDPCGGDSDLAIAEDGTLYFTDLQTLITISTYTSTDGGQTWAYHPDASMVPGDDRQWIETGPDAGPLAGSHHAAYLAFNHLASNVYVTKSTDGGQTWVGRTIVLDQPQTNFWSMGNMVVDPVDGSVYVVYTLGNAARPVGDGTLPTDDMVRVSVSRDGALTWESFVVSDPDRSPGHIFPVIAQDQAGRLYVVWSQETEDHMEIQMAVSADQGRTWTAPVRVNQHNGSAVLPWIDATGDGQVAIAWYGTNETLLASQVTGDWFVYYTQGTVAADGSLNLTETKAWDEAIRTGAICTTGITCSGDRELLDFFQVRLDGSGNAHMVFADTNHEEGTTVYYAKQVGGPRLVPLPVDA